MNWPLLTVLTATPLAGAVVLLTLNERQARLARRVALAFAGLALALAAWLWASFDPRSSGLQFIERHPWIPTLGVEYFVGIDGLGLLLVLLTAIVTPMSVLAASAIKERARLYFALVLFLQAGLFGTFTALNFFHWFLFWELSLVPAFFLIKLWGGLNRTLAATQFFIYTMVGSVTLLLAFMALALATGTLDFMRLAALAKADQLAPAVAAKLAWSGWTNEQLMLLICAGALLGFAVKVPLFPFHTWLPLTYAEAPTATTMLLTGVMSKMGVYGFLRILAPIFPDQMRALGALLLWLAIFTIVFSAFAAFAQRDLKRLFAYSSINHLGYCLLGVFAAMKLTDTSAPWTTEKAAVLNGVLLQMFNHGLTAAALFGFVGSLEQRSGGRRAVDDFGGLRKIAPVFCGLMGISVFASLGLPGLNGFVGEFLIFKGAFALAPWAAAFAVLGLLVTAVFLLTVLQRVFHGPLSPQRANFQDLTTTERWTLGPAVALMFLIGIYPQLLVGFTNATVLGIVSHLAP